MRFGERLFEAVLEVGLCCFELVLGDVTTTHERFGVERADTALRFNQVVHQRLRHRRVVTLVVATASVTHEVDDDVGVEFLAVLERHFCHAKNSFGVVTVDVENGRLDGFRDVSGIDTAA